MQALAFFQLVDNRLFILVAQSFPLRYFHEVAEAATAIARIFVYGADGDAGGNNSVFTCHTRSMIT